MDVAHIYESFQSNANSDWNKISLVSYWKIGQRIVEVEQGNQEKASYGDRILIQLSKDLNKRFGRIFRIGTYVICDVSFNFINLGKFVPNFLGLIIELCFL
ncbi:PF06250 domain protein [Leptospira santarosai str. HAI821]|nr:PF06250 domain protein [Leptospira santarosai str. HAI821]